MFLEAIMTLSDIIFEMELGGVDNEDISVIVNSYKEQVMTPAQIDEQLLNKGYAPIFTVNYDDYDEIDDDYMYEKSHPSRQEWEE